MIFFAVAKPSKSFNIQDFVPLSPPFWAETLEHWNVFGKEPLEKSPSAAYQKYLPGAR